MGTRCTGGNIGKNSLYSRILDKLGVTYEINAPLPEFISLGDSAANVVEAEIQLEHHSFDMVVAGEMSRWWGEHRAQVIEHIGFEAAMHVHACAASVAAANMTVSRLAPGVKPNNVQLTALHSLALKYVADRERDTFYDILYSWADECGGVVKLQMQECLFLVAARFTTGR